MKKELELYELALLLKYAPEDQLSENLKRYQTLLTEKGSQLMIKNHGKISLAYNIQGFDTATYIQVVYTYIHMAVAVYAQNFFAGILYAVEAV